MIPDLPERTHFADSSVLPLVNVAFLLLVFFLAAAVLQAPRLAVIEAPEASSGEDRRAVVNELAVDAAGELWLAGVPLDRGGLDAALVALAASGATGVVVRIDRAAEATHLGGVLAAASAAGFTAVELVTVGAAP